MMFVFCYKNSKFFKEWVYINDYINGNSYQHRNADYLTVDNLWVIFIFSNLVSSVFTVNYMSVLILTKDISWYSFYIKDTKIYSIVQINL